MGAGTLAVVIAAAGTGAAAVAFRHHASHPRPPLVAPGQVVRIPVGRAPQPIVADDAAAWVVTGTWEPTVVWRIDARTDQAVELPQTKGAAIPAVGEGFAWATCPGDTGSPCGGNFVLKLDPRTGAILARIRLPGYPFAMAAGLGDVWVSTKVGLAKIDPTTDRVVGTFPVQAEALGTAGRYVWAAGAARHQNGVVAIDPSSGRIVRTIAFHDPCTFLATGRAVWVASCQGGLPPGSPPDMLARIDSGTGRVSYRVPLDQWGSLSYTVGRLWLAHWIGNHVEIEALDPATGKPTGTLTIYPGPRPWSNEGIGVPGVGIAMGDRSFWLTHVDYADVVRVGTGPVTASRALILDLPYGFERFAAAPAGTQANPTAAQAMARFEGVNHFALPPGAISELGYYTAAVGSGAYRYYHKLVWGFRFHQCVSSRGFRPGRLISCTRWLFLDSNTGQMLEAVSQQ